MLANQPLAGPHEVLSYVTEMHRQASLRTAVALGTLGTFALAGLLAGAGLRVPVGGLLAIGGLLRATSALTWGDRPRVRVADVATGVAYVAVGAMLVAGAHASATLVLGAAALLAIAGLVRIVSSSSARAPGFRFSVAHGLVSLVLGAAVWARWPFEGLFALGLAAAVDMITGAIATAATAPAAEPSEAQ